MEEEIRKQIQEMEKRYAQKFSDMTDEMNAVAERLEATQKKLEAMQRNADRVIELLKSAEDRHYR